MQPNLEGLLRELVRADVAFVVVGGFAAVVHGSTSVMFDLDVCCDFGEANLMRLGNALSGMAPAHRMTPQRIALEVTPQFCRGIRNLHLSTSYGQIDCLSEVKGVGGYPEVLACSEAIALPWGTCRVLTLDALIRAKRAMGRPRDLQTVLQLESIRERQGSDGG